MSLIIYDDDYIPDTANTCPGLSYCTLYPRNPTFWYKTENGDYVCHACKTENNLDLPRAYDYILLPTLTCSYRLFSLKFKIFTISLWDPEGKNSYEFSIGEEGIVTKDKSVVYTICVTLTDDTTEYFYKLKNPQTGKTSQYFKKKGILGEFLVGQTLEIITYQKTKKDMRLQSGLSETYIVNSMGKLLKKKGTDLLLHNEFLEERFRKPLEIKIS